MTLARRMGALESARLVLRRVAPDDLPFFTRVHALPEVSQYLYPAGRPLVTGGETRLQPIVTISERTPA